VLVFSPASKGSFSDNGSDGVSDRLWGSIGTQAEPVRTCCQLCWSIDC